MEFNLFGSAKLENQQLQHIAEKRRLGHELLEQCNERSKTKQTQPQSTTTKKIMHIFKLRINRIRKKETIWLLKRKKKSITENEKNKKKKTFTL